MTYLKKKKKKTLITENYLVYSSVDLSVNIQSALVMMNW